MAWPCLHMPTEGCREKATVILLNYSLWQHSSQMTSQQQVIKDQREKKNMWSSGEDFKTTRDRAANPVLGKSWQICLDFISQFFCFTQVKHESGQVPPPILAKHATQLFPNRQSDVITTHHSSSSSGYLAEISSVYDARAGTEDKYTRVRASIRTHTRARELANHSSVPCVQSWNGKSESCFFPTWEASSITDVTWSNRLCSTTFVRWLNVMSCLCYFSLSQLLGTRVTSSTQWDITTLLPVTSPITDHAIRW